MLKRLAGAAMFVGILFGAAGALFAQNLPITGELDKTNWSLPKTGLTAFLPPAAQDSAEVTADKVAYAVRDLKQGLVSDGGQFLFNKSGALYQVAVVRLYNLEPGNTAQTFREFVAATTDNYAKKLGQADRDDTKTAAGPADSSLAYATIVWKANSRRAVGPTLKIEISFFSSGTFIFYAETCTNTAVAAK
jgi:hypothetical protein